MGGGGGGGVVGVFFPFCQPLKALVQCRNREGCCVFVVRGKREAGLEIDGCGGGGEGVGGGEVGRRCRGYMIDQCIYCLVPGQFELTGLCFHNRRMRNYYG